MTKAHKVYKHRAAKHGSYPDGWKIATFVFAALFIGTLIFHFVSVPTENVGISANEDNVDEKTATGSTAELSGLILTDSRCETCPIVIEQVKAKLLESFPNLQIEEVDYATEEGKALYEETESDMLPAMFFKDGIEKADNYNTIEQYVEVIGDYKSLRLGGSFDPTKEICGNGIDDTGDGLVDCASSDCSGEWACAEKKDKPVVELFVMSYCPYGTQMEKGMLPVVKELGDKIDFQLKFVNYAMHGEKEVIEQTVQYCIQKEYNEKLVPYLECFLKEGNSEECIAEVELEGKLEDCIAVADEEFGITEGLENKDAWMGRFPPFNIDAEDNIKYGVRGSPFLVINGVQPQAGRDSASIFKAVCSSFTEAPEECSKELSSAPPSTGFGFEPSTGNTATGGCEV